jgi:hypothetical protein
MFSCIHVRAWLLYLNILWLSHLTKNFRLLLLLIYTLDNLKKVKISICKVQFLKSAKFAKYLIKEGELIFDRITGVS